MQKRILGFLLIFATGFINAQSFDENFDQVDSLLLNGWISDNNSNPQGSGSWAQDNGNFVAFNGPTNSSIVCGYTSIPLAQSGDISNWLITPTIQFTTGDSIVFWTISYQNGTYPDRLEVRLNRNNTTDAGSTSSSVGDFDTTLLVINPSLFSGGAYPMVWTRYAFKIEGVNPSQPCRLGFRYYVTNGGQAGANGSTIGIDHFQYKSNVIGIENETTLLAFVQLINEQIIIHVPESTDPFNVELMDISGKVVLSGNYLLTATINTEDYSGGIYMVKILYHGKYLIKKISF